MSNYEDSDQTQKEGTHRIPPAEKYYFGGATVPPISESLSKIDAALAMAKRARDLVLH